METTSLTLLDRLRQPGDDLAWGQFVELYTPVLLNWACRQGENAEDAADLVQDIFVALLQALPGFQRHGTGAFRRWLKAIMMNRLRDRKRRQARMVKAFAELPPSPDIPNGADMLAEAEFQQQLARRALELMQAEFQPGTWKACWETLVVGRPLEEVAHELGMTENAVYLARWRVLRRLRQRLNGLID
jgi:RNA polymerase sigma-70 factor (ECF subfamily)